LFLVFPTISMKNLEKFGHKESPQFEYQIVDV
jgi:hypothetical protein